VRFIFELTGLMTAGTVVAANLAIASMIPKEKA
jgi:phage shock protein PspC (stress-responsive transcriptional regulator)